MIDIMSLGISELAEFAVSHGEKSFRGKQMHDWLKNGINSFDDMKNLPNSLIDSVKKECFLSSCTAERVQISSDGTRKYLFALYDGERIEAVFMKYKYGNTICISTQAGCRMGCTFCASTLNGLKRNLLPSEMLWQLLAAQRDTGERISHIVLMGMGEPLDNYDNVLTFLRLVNSDDGLNIGMRNISLSTCGLIDKIDRLAEENLQLTLSVSLHAPNGDIRKSLMPVANKYGYDELLDACKRYENKTGRRVSFEYALISGVNDRICDAEELGRKLKGTLCHVNLIPLNQTERKNYKRSDKNDIERFVKAIEKYRVTTTVRRSLGGDISAACGQLKAESEV